MAVLTRKNGVRGGRFPCNKCDHVTTTKYFLNTHKREHEKEIKIKEAEKRSAVYVKCDDCHSTFDTKKRLENHKLNEHDTQQKIKDDEETESPERKKQKEEEKPKQTGKAVEEITKVDTTLEENKEPNFKLDEQLIESYKSEIETYKVSNAILHEDVHKIKQIQLGNQRYFELEKYGDEIRAKYDNLKIKFTDKENEVEEMGELLLKAAEERATLLGEVWDEKEDKESDEEDTVKELNPLWEETKEATEEENMEVTFVENKPNKHEVETKTGTKTKKVNVKFGDVY